MTGYLRNKPDGGAPLSRRVFVFRVDGPDGIGHAMPCIAWRRCCDTGARRSASPIFDHLRRSLRCLSAAPTDPCQEPRPGANYSNTTTKGAASAAKVRALEALLIEKGRTWHGLEGDTVLGHFETWRGRSMARVSSRARGSIPLSSASDRRHAQSYRDNGLDAGQVWRVGRAQAGSKTANGVQT